MVAEVDADFLQRNPLVLPVVERDNHARDYLSQEEECRDKERHDGGIGRIYNVRPAMDTTVRVDKERTQSTLEALYLHRLT